MGVVKARTPPHFVEWARGMIDREARLIKCQGVGTLWNLAQIPDLRQPVNVDTIK